MTGNIRFFPSITDTMQEKIRFQAKKYEFFYLENKEEHSLIEEAIEFGSSIMIIKDDKGKWNPDDYNIGFHRKYFLQTFHHLFGQDGVACHDSVLGLAVVWTSSDSKQRGAVEIGRFCKNDRELEADVKKIFGKAQLRGRIDFTTIIYLAEPGHPNKNEKHLVNTAGYILGELEKYSIKIDGHGSVFPIFEVSKKGFPLWYVDCGWSDSTIDLFEDAVSININTAHKNYKYIDRESKLFDPQLLSEVMAGALCVIIEKARLEAESWEQIMNNDSLEPGSVGEAIHYFQETLGWDMGTPEAVSLSARRFFDQRM